MNKKYIAKNSRKRSTAKRKVWHKGRKRLALKAKTVGSKTEKKVGSKDVEGCPHKGLLEMAVVTYRNGLVQTTFKIKTNAKTEAVYAWRHSCGRHQERCGLCCANINGHLVRFAVVQKPERMPAPGTVS